MERVCDYNQSGTLFSLRVGQQPELSMILGMSLGAFTILHVIITLVAIGSGLIVVGGMFASHRLPVTTALFLFTTALWREEAKARRGCPLADHRRGD